MSKTVSEVSAQISAKVGASFNPTVALDHRDVANARNHAANMMTESEAAARGKNNSRFKQRLNLKEAANCRSVLISTPVPRLLCF